MLHRGLKKKRLWTWTCAALLVVLAGGVALAGGVEQKLVASGGVAGDKLGTSVAIDLETAVVGAPAESAERGAAYVYVRHGGLFVEQAKLTASDGAADDAFGVSVAVSGDTAVVGAFGDDDFRGSAYVFVRSRGVWTQQAKLTAADAEAGDWLGWSVAVSGDTVVVGARHDDADGFSSGSAYVFTRSGDAWTQQDKLTASDAEGHDYFGWSVALSADTAVIGAYGDSDDGSSSGSAYVFVRSGGVWIEQDKLTASDAAAHDEFGYSVALSGDTAVVGAYGDDVFRGAAYVFVRSGGVWGEQKKLTASDATANDWFGRSVAMSGDTAVVGALYDGDGVLDDTGSAYVFVRSAGEWTERPKLTASDAAADDWFGRSVAVSGDTAVVGAYGDDDDGSRSGSAYAYRLPVKLTAADAEVGDYFGYHVAVSGDTAVVGSWWDDDGGSQSGSAYVFVRSEGVWTQQAKLTAADAAAHDGFGNSVAVSGDTVVVGALSGGSAYVFVRSEGVWTQQAKLTAADAASIGFSVALSGDTALVGGSGSAYVFVRSGGVWTQQQKLGDYFGFSVALSGDTALVASWRDEVGGLAKAGSAYVFVRSGGVWTKQARLIAADAAANDQFGWTVAVSGDTAVVGAHYDDDGGGGSGSAYVFIRSGDAWTQQEKLTASDAAANAQFGNAVAVNGDSAVVGAWAANGYRGSAYVFARSGGVWTQQEKLTAADAAPDDRFSGWSIGLSGDTAVIGAAADDDGGNATGSAWIFGIKGSVWTADSKLTASDAAAGDAFGRCASVSGESALVGAPSDDHGGRTGAGAAYAYERSGGGWTERQKLTASDAAGGDSFGWAVSMSGETALVGASLDDDGGSDSGSAYVFSRSAGTWSEGQKLTASDAGAGDFFGFTLALDGDVAVVGAYGNDDDGSDSGSAYVFVRSGETWTEQQKLTASDAAGGDEFGRRVAIHGDTIAVGAHGSADDGANSGAVYVFVRSGSTWTEQERLTASDAAAGDHFGNALDVSGDCLAVGAWGEDDGGGQSGAVYVFERSGTEWEETRRLSASDAAAGAEFGRAVSLEDGTLVVGASLDDEGGAGSGAAYVFVGPGGVWTEYRKLTAFDAAADDEFGRWVAVGGDVILVGARLDDDDGADSGSTYSFARPEIEVLTESLPPAVTTSIQYSRQLDRTGGVGPYTWEVSDGVFPMTGALDAATGLIDGTWGTAGDYVFSLGVVDAWGRVAERSYAITVNPWPSPSTTPFPDTTTGRPYQYTASVSGGTAPFTWSVTGDLPVSGGMDPSTGELSGVARAPGTYAFTARVSDRWGAASSQAYQVTVNPLPQITTQDLLFAVMDRPLRVPLMLSGGTPEFSWTLNSGALPPGLGLDPATGEISGTPTELGSSDFVVGCTDVAGEDTEREFTLDVAPVMELPKRKYVERLPFDPGDGLVPLCRTLELVAGTRLAVTVKLPKRDSQIELVILDGAQRELDVTVVTKPRRRLTLVKRFAVPATDRYFVVLRPLAPLDGTARLTVRVTPPARETEKVTLVAGEPQEVKLGALPGARVTIVVNALRRSAAMPTIFGVTDDDGNELLVPSELRLRKKRAVLRMRTPVPGGTLTVRIGTRDGTAGDVKWTATIKEPRGYSYSDPDLPVGDGP